MHNFSIGIILFFTLISGSFSYAIEGNWEVIEIQNDDLVSNQTISIRIKDFIFRKVAVRRALTLETSCFILKYHIDIVEDELYINMKSSMRERIQYCSSQMIILENGLHTMMKKVFKFQILGTNMIFLDYSGKVILKAKRQSPKKIINLEGNWIIEVLNSQNYSQLLEIIEEKFIFCQGKTTLLFKIHQRNKIIFEEFEDNCESQELMEAFQNISYYRQQKDKLTFYSKYVRPILVLRMYTPFQDMQSQANSDRVESNNLQQSRMINQERNSKEEAKIQNPLKDLTGKWKIHNIFGLPIFMQQFDFIITEDEIVLTGGCNTHIVSYEFKNHIQVSQVRSTKNVCKGDEDELYKRGLEKINDFEVKQGENQITVQLKDENGGLVYEIKKAISSKQQVEKNYAQSLNMKEEQEKQPLPDGRYMMLLLKKRSLPRRMLTIRDGIGSLRICNRIKYQIKQNNKQIQFQLQSKEGNESECDIESQNKYLGYLEEARDYQQQDGDFILSDGKGTEIITLDLVGV